MSELISVSSPIIGEAEKQAVMEVLDSGIVAQGPKVAELEEKFADYCGTKYAVAVSSGTAALHTALQAAGVGPGDSVITTPFTFIATSNSIMMQGAKPKFVDIEPDSFNLDASKLEDAYDQSVKAVLPVDLYGQPADYDEINYFAADHGLTVVEDACQSVGAVYLGWRAGSLGHLACFSLYATKNIMSAEGGIITTDSEEFVKSAKSFRQHGMDMNGQYEYSQMGYNYRTSDVLAAMAITQLSRADNFNRARIYNAQQLTAGLEDVEGLITPVIKPDRNSVFHQYTLRVSEDYPLSRQELIGHLKEKGVGTGIYYPRPLHLYPHIASLGYQEGDFPVAEQAAKEVVSLPVHPSLSNLDLERIIESIRGASNV